MNSEIRIGFVFYLVMFRHELDHFQDEVRAGQAERGPHHCRLQGDTLQGVPQGQAVAELVRLLLIAVIGHSGADQPRSALFPGN